LKNKPISSLLELYQNVDMEERKLVDLLFDPISSTAKPEGALEFLIGPDKGNFYKNMLLNGYISHNPSGYDLDPNSPRFLLKSRYLSNGQTHSIAAHLNDALHDLQYFVGSEGELELPSIPRSEEASARLYLMQILNRIQKGGLKSIAEPDRIATERLRTLIQAIIYKMDNEIPADKAWLARILSDRTAAILSEGGSKTDLTIYNGPFLRRALSHPATQEDVVLTPEQLGIIYDVRGAEFQDRAISEHGSAKDFYAMEKTLKKGKRDYSALSRTTKPPGREFYGRTLAKEERGLPEGDLSETPADRIGRVLAEKGLGFNSEDRIRLANSLPPFSQHLLAEMLVAAAENDKAREKNPSLESKSPREVFRPSFDSLVKVAFDPKEKEGLLSVSALLSWGNHPESNAHFLADLEHQAWSRYLLVFEEGLSFENAAKLGPEKREKMLAQIEARLTSTAPLTAEARDILQLMSLVLREWGHSPDKLYGRNLQEAMQAIGYSEQPVDHATLKSQRKKFDTELAADGGKQALGLVKEVKEHLQSTGYGIPLKAELGLQQFLIESGDRGQDALLYLRKNLPAKKFADLIKQLKPGEPQNHQELIETVLRDELPHFLPLLTSSQSPDDRLFTKAVNQILETGQISNYTQNLVLQSGLYQRFPEARFLIQNSEKLMDAAKKEYEPYLESFPALDEKIAQRAHELIAEDKIKEADTSFDKSSSFLIASLTLDSFALIKKNNQEASVTLWSNSCIISRNQDTDELLQEKAITILMNMFMKDYYSVNTKQPTFQLVFQK
jgi:hypothetical protein